MKRSHLLLLVCILTAVSNLQGQGRRDSLYRMQREMTGVNLPDDAKWFNAAKSFDAFDVADRILLVHFWNPRIPASNFVLKRMNALHAEKPFVVVVSVLANGLPAERRDANVDELIKAHGVNHPVLLAEDFSRLGLETEPRVPALTGIRDNAQGMGLYEGIDDIETFLAGIELIDNGKARAVGLATNRYLPLVQHDPWVASMQNPLHMEASNREQRMFIADSYNNRVIIIDEDGFVSDVIGTGKQGWRDGKFGASQLSHPCGLAYDETSATLYIADAHNHCIRAANLRSRELTTVLGNGQRNAQLPTFIDSTSQGLNFPKGLAMGPGKVVIAMSGANQLWELDIRTKRARAVAGDGEARTLDGERQMASFNCPTYISAAGEGRYYVTDAGSNSLRFIDANWQVQTTPVANLDEFEGLVWSGHAVSGDLLFVNDAFGHRILQLKDKELKIVSGSGEPGFADHRKSQGSFHLPSDVAILNGEILVLDGRNNAVRKVSRKRGKTKTLDLRNFDLLFRNIEAYNTGYQGYFEELTLGKGLNTVHIELKLEEGLKWEEDGRMEVYLDYGGNNRLISSRPRKGFIEVECPGNEMNANINLQVYVTVRDMENNQVYFKPMILFLPFLFDEDAAKVHDLEYRPFAQP